MKTENSSSSGLSIIELLGVAFIILKLCGVINWSWWWVTVPFWGGFAIVILILIFVAIINMRR